MRTAGIEVPRPRPIKASSADDWFFALDQRQFGNGDHSWVAHVLGIHRENGGLWVQMAPQDNPAATIVLRVSTSTQLEQAVAALERVEDSSQGYPRIIDLTRANPVH